MPTAPKRLGAPASGAKRMEYRPAAHKRGYDYIWSKVAKRARARDCNLCQPCRRAGRTVVCDLVDHIVPVHVRPDWRLTLDNTECQCYSCHRIKTAKDNREYGSREAARPTMQQQMNRNKAMSLEHPPKPSANRFVVYGPPCAGKTTYVKERFEEGDMVWDYDAIASSITLTSVHHSPLWVAGIMEQMRCAFISAAHECSGTVWVIACMPSVAKRCAVEMGAELVRIAPDIDECKRRAKGRRREGCDQGIEQWFSEDANGEHAHGR